MLYCRTSFQALVEGTAAMTLMYRVTPEKSKFCHLMRPTLFTNCCFITAKPKRIESSSDPSTLLSPLTLPVWLCITASFIFLLAAIAFTVQISRWKNDAATREFQSPACSAILFHSILKSLLSPIFAQSASASFLAQSLVLTLIIIPPETRKFFCGCLVLL